VVSSSDINPLEDFSALPRFSDIEPSIIKPAVDSLLSNAKSSIDKVVSSSALSWEDTVFPITASVDRLSRAWGQVSHLNAVSSNPELRSIFNEILPSVTEFYTTLSQNKDLYNKLLVLRQSDEYEKLSEEQRKVLENELRDYQLSGVGLDVEKQRDYKELSKELAAQSAKFSDNVLDATDAYQLHVPDEERLSGLSEAHLSDAKDRADKKNLPGWVFNLQAPSWIPFMESCEDRELREEMYRAYVTRASAKGDPAFDNSEQIISILRARSRKAELLGFETFADLSFATKMASGPKDAISLLNELSRKAKPFADKELSELKEYAKERLQISDLKPWDVSYVAQKVKEERYSFKDEDLRPYFPVSKVMGGLFELLHQLYGVSVVEEKVDVWHPDVTFFSVRGPDDETLGFFYADLFARDGKRSGAWMDDAIGRWKRQGSIQKPVAYLVCNFPPISKDASDSYLSHSEVETLFHECGHVMHHLMTRVDEIGVSGINGVEWDAVELPSQFMENFCWDWTVIKEISVGDEGGDHLPEEVFKKMLDAKHFMSGIQTLRQVEFALFDLRVHMEGHIEQIKDVYTILDSVREQVSVLQVPEYNQFPNSFSHIFAGGYAAGYYSYKWAEVLSADVYAMSRDAGLSISQLGRRFLDDILSMGGLRPSAENFQRFRGREPTVDALLASSGLA